MNDYQRISQEMKKRRSSKHWTKQDINRIQAARETGDWREVHCSSLYKQHGGEFCSLLEVLYLLSKEGAAL